MNLDQRNIRRNLNRWFERNHRDLPWRRTGDPYLIWVSEVMLQQTQVETVVPYFLRWAEKFPTVDSLALAAPSKVLKAWEGLGYYARARNLHRAAREVVKEHGGRVPDDLDSLMALPGVGPYTAGAILSIAYDRPVAAVDGNVSRVVSRLLNLRKDPTSNAGSRAVAQAAQFLVPATKSGQFNQALMELGARICRPAAPLCGRCPIRNQCGANQAGTQEEIPIRRASQPVKKLRAAMGIIRRDGRILVQRRPETELMGGLWEFPRATVVRGRGFEKALLTFVRAELGGRIQIVKKEAELSHSFTRFSENVRVFSCRYEKGDLRPREGVETRWVTPGSLARLAMSSVNRRAAKLVARDKTP